MADANRGQRRPQSTPRVGPTHRPGPAVAQDRPSDAAAPSPEVAVLAGERRAELLAAIGRLREDDRLAIGLRWFAELGEAEMAEVLGVPRGTVKSRLSRAMARLREIMAEGAKND